MRTEAELVQHLTSSRAPWIVTLAPPAWGVIRAGLQELEGVRVVEVSGRQARTKEAFFADASRALRFPSYFGENWDAFEECLRDLDWLPARAYVMAVTDADRLLEEDAEERRTFVAIVESAAADWALRGPPIPFHVVLVTPTGI